MSTNDDITRRDFAKMTAAVTVVAGGTLGAGSRAAKAAAPAQAMTASDAIGAIARGDLSAEEYAGALLARADELKDLNACILLNRDGLLEGARAIDMARRKGNKLGRLSGLPLLVKDNIDTKGMPTTGGTKALGSNRPKQDAPVLSPLFESGALLMAKTNMHELAFGITSTNPAYGFVKNPYNKAMIPGGSSGGTAVGIAARMSPAGLGSDTGGSVRIPPALCGIVGLRPSVGNGNKRYPDRGVVPISHTRDTVGPMARTVADVALLDSVITGDAAPQPASLKGVRIGLPRGYFWEGLDGELAQVLDVALARLRDSGVVLVEADLAGIGGINDKISFPIALYEVGPDLTAYLAGEGNGIGFDTVVAGIASKDVAGAFAAAKTIPKEAYDAAIMTGRPQLQKLYADYFKENDVDAVIFPTTPLPARPINPDGDTGKDTVELNGKEVPTFPTYIRNTDPGSNAGIPGLSLPAGLTKSNLPVGLELDGPVGSDQRLLALGLAIETALGVLPPPNI
jgi:Asp-tRNA(Asn)/Glu-tRNA(Gln) amidotransferase A subunit family amidase